MIEYEVSLPPLQSRARKQAEITHYPFHSIKQLTTMNDCPNLVQVRFKVMEYLPTNLDEAIVAYCMKCQM